MEASHKFYMSIFDETYRGGMTCSNKNSYESESEATAVKNHREKESGVSLSVYRCLDCGAWHLTSAKHYTCSSQQ